MMRYLNRLITLKQELGALNAGFYLLNRLFKTIRVPVFFVKYYFFSQPLCSERFLPEGKGKNFTTKELTDDYQDDNPCPRPLSVIKSRYQQGATCFVICREQEFVGCFWYAKKRYREDEVRCIYKLLNDQSVWDFDVFVLPKYRLTTAFLKLWDDVSEKLLAEGYSNSISRISAFNAISLSSHQRMGARILGWATFLCVGHTQFTFSSLSPYLHISVNESSYPVFEIK